jgi:FkbM family methyltransferase
VWVKRAYDFELACEAPRSIIDAGANTGFSSVFFALKYPDARVVALEPEPENFSFLVRNTADAPNVVAIQGALWSTEGTLPLFDPGIGSWGFRVENATPTTPGSASLERLGEVAALTVDRIRRDQQWAEVDILKLDIEGAELDVLESASQWIGSVTCLVAELHDRFRPGCREAFETATADFSRKSRRGDLDIACR